MKYLSTALGMDTLAPRVAFRWKQSQEDMVAARVPAIPRDIYLPKEVRGTPPNVDAEGTDLAIWTYEVGQVPYAIGFVGAQSKPLFHNRFRNEAERQRVISSEITNRKRVLEFKQQRQQERREFKHSYAVGDILSTSWGYDQTNVDFYEVIEVRGAMLVVREVSEVLVRSDEGGTDYVVAQPGKFVGPPLRVKPTTSGVKIEGHHASKWDGKPKYQTAFGWGH